MKGRRRIPVTVCIDMDLLEKLDEIAKKNSVNRSELVNFLIKISLSTVEPGGVLGSIV